MRTTSLAALTGSLLAFRGTVALPTDDYLGPNIIIPTTSGKVIGHRAPSRPGVTEFLGIPFAQTPIGDLRFAAPRAYSSDKTFLASKFVRRFNLCYPVLAESISPHFEYANRGIHSLCKSGAYAMARSRAL